ncbi:MAG: translocation/assembly module TamB domain-containing protein, partial [Leptolyngbyaceae bacterium]|nr:translocation/assembly module TamB domain-containing protein [Leptolyngbyaceae bacterium]
WTGEGLQIEEFTAPDVSASGFIAVALDGAPAIGNVDLDVAVRQYDLMRVASLLPPAVQEQARLRGLVSFNGDVSGTLENPQVVGTAQLDNLALNELDFNSSLQGVVDFSLAQGGVVDLQGDGDRIFARLDDRYVPTEFVIRNGGEGIADDEAFTIAGQTQGDILTAEARNFRLSELQYNPLPDQDIGQVRGVVNANIQANIADLSNPSIRSSVAIAQPALGYIEADQFTGELSYINGNVMLADGLLILGESRYLLNARANVLDPAIPYQADLVVEEGQVQDVLTALQIFSFDDVGRGIESPQYEGSDAIPTTPVGLSPNASLLNQLIYISALATQRQVAIAQKEDAPIPPLEELEGSFEGTIAASGSVQSGFLVDFDIEGNDWEWGRFDQPNTFVVTGRATPQQVTIKPFRFESGETLVAFDGQVGLTQASRTDGTLEVANVPADLVQEFVALPVDIEGDIQSTVDLAGSLDNPELDGTIILANAELNNTPLEQAEVDFRYDEARLVANGGVFITGQEGLTIEANIPYALPFMSVQPDSDRIAVDLDVSDDGLAFLSILSDGQAVWEGGEGDVDLQVTGTLEQPLIQGRATFEDGIITSPFLEDPVTAITGTANFDLDRVTIDQLTAQFDDGQIAVEGTLPIFTAAAQDPDNALVLSFTETPIRLQNLLSADVNGNVTVTGAVLSPVIGGTVNVADGRAFALNFLRRRGNGAPETVPVSNEPDATVETASDENTSPTVGTTSETASNPFLDRVRFDDLRIFLSDSLQIVGRPIFDLSAEGDLVVNGTFDDIRPDGTIQLTDGWINIISTQFRLSDDAPNTATFTPDDGLDPYLDLQLVAQVRETSRVPIAPSSPFSGSEVIDQTAVPTFGGLETVDVFATVDGRASQLSDNLELTSDPTRSENQIVALLGGRTLDAFQSGDIAGGVAAFAGSGFLAGFGNDIADALGISEFRIFPTTGDIGGESRLPLTVGVEVGFDITQDFSISVLEILDGNTSPQFNFRYELTDRIRLRASTDLDEDNRAIIEFRDSF